MTPQIIGAILRAILASIGGAGLASDNDVEQLSGAVAVLVTVAWSIYQKYEAKKAK